MSFAVPITVWGYSPCGRKARPAFNLGARVQWWPGPRMIASKPVAGTWPARDLVTGNRSAGNSDQPAGE